MQHFSIPPLPIPFVWPRCSKRSPHEAMDLAVGIRVEGFGRVVADVFVWAEFAAPLAAGQLHCGMLPIPSPVSVQWTFLKPGSAPGS